MSAETLIDRVWGSDIPPKARNALWSYVSRLRRLLGSSGDARLVTRAGSYILETDPERIDLHRFRRLRAQANAISDSGDNEQAALLLRGSDELWRGEPLAGLHSDWARQVRAVLEQERLAATLERVDAELALGRETELARELSQLVPQYPLVESVVERLMIALYRAGRQAEALDAYQQARKRLIRDLGTEPGPPLRQIQQRILRGDTALARAGRTRRRGGPNNLPRDIPYFTGRHEELGTLAQTIISAQAKTAAAVVAIDGMAGVGKSTLAIHTAYRLAGQFPDGQIFLGLHAHHPYEDVVDPAAGLDALLRVLGESSREAARAGGRSQAWSVEELAALWRERTAGRRLLLVLDDAASRDQVLPLLPGSPGCLVIITSRHRLTVPPGALSLPLDVLTPAEATELFARVAGPEHAQDRAAVAETVRLCGNMPLAIEVAANRLRHRPAWTVADLAQRLASTQHRLREIRGEELEVASSFALSYRYLSREQQRLFRQAGAYPGLDFSLHAAAAAASLPAVQAEHILEALIGCHLLDEHAPGRFRCHDLISEYARELALREDTEPDRLSAMHRLLDYYLYQAQRADQRLYPHRHRMGAQVTHVPAELPETAGEDGARAWLTAERLNLMSATQFAARHGLLSHATLIPHAIAQFLEDGGYWQDATTVHELAIDNWRQAGDPHGEALAHSDLCVSRVRMGDFAGALAHGTAGLEGFRAAHDHAGEAAVLDRLGLVHYMGARFHDALAYHDRSLKLHRAIGSPHGEAEALGHSGIAHWHLGNYRQALSSFEMALPLYREIGDRRGEAKMLTNIGEVQKTMGAHTEALAYFEQALPIAQEFNARQGEAVLLNNIGDACQNTGRYDDALGYLRQALGIYRDIGDQRCEADTLNNIGTTYHRMQRNDEALIHHQKALEIAQRIGEDYEAARAMRSLGDTYHAMGRFSTALEHSHEALGLSRRIGDPKQEAQALSSIGDTLLHTQGERAAGRYWQEALALFERLGLPEAAVLRARLAGGHPPAAP